MSLVNFGTLHRSLHFTRKPVYYVELNAPKKDVRKIKIGDSLFRTFTSGNPLSQDTEYITERPSYTCLNRTS